MSYFLFGSFDSKYKQLTQSIKSYGNKKNVYFYFNEEINFYKDILRMCDEQNLRREMIFAMTSDNQPCNSSDLLFPYDKFTNEELFKDPTRNYFKKCCRDNIEILFDCLQRLMEIFCPKQISIFVVEGYDTDFQKKKCTLMEMKQDLLRQIEANSFIDSCIYEILNESE